MSIVTRYPLSEKQIELISKFDKIISQVESLINDSCIDGRYKSLAITNLEQCSMWISKSIAVNGIVISENFE